MPRANKPPQQNIVSAAWLELPKGLTIDVSKDALIITRKWFSPKYIFFIVFGLIWNIGLWSGVYQAGIWIYLFLPHGWLGLWLAYQALTGLFNATSITVNTSRIIIEHHPIPYPGNKRLEANILKQLYTKQKTKRNSHTYEVRVLTTSGQDKPLLTGLDRPEQAMYLEQQIEEFLGIRNEPVAGEAQAAAPQYQRFEWDSWQRFAQNNQLNFASGKFLEAYGVYGIYQGYKFKLIPRRNKSSGSIGTHIELAIASQSYNPISGDNLKVVQPLARAAVNNYFNPTGAKYSLKGKVGVRNNGREIFYEQPGFEANVKYLQFLLELLSELMDIYPRVVALGGEATPILQPIAAKKESFLHPQEKDHPLRLAAIPLLQDISRHTADLRQPIPRLLCQRCLVYCAAHSVNIPGMDAITYYGCRMCHQSRDFYTVDRVIAVLDTQMAVKPVFENQILRVNWLVKRTLFDFDAVEIIQAGDEDVERFAVQVGNDTDPFRQTRSNDRRCFISAQRQLSPNSLRILQHTFGQVEVLE